MAKFAIIDYFKITLGINPEIELFKEKSKLPLYLRTSYELYIVRMFNHTLLMAHSRSDTEITPANSSKQMKILRDLTGLNTVLVLDSIDSLLRKRLIDNKISFIVPGKQMYLPLLLINLSDDFAKSGEKRVLFSPSTQVLILYSIYNELPKPVTPNELGTKLGYTKMTMSRVIDELVDLDICKVEQKGKNRFAWLKYEGQELWERSTSLLRSPVKRKIYARFPLIKHESLPLAGISALAEKTLIASDNALIYAISKNQFTVLQQNKKLEIVNHAYDAQFQLELWHYSPSILNKGHGDVDDLSLFLSLREEVDERIQLALKEMMVKFKWR